MVLDLCDSHEQCHSWKGRDKVHVWKLAFSKLQGLARSPACGWSAPALFPASGTKCSNPARTTRHLHSCESQVRTCSFKMSFSFYISPSPTEQKNTFSQGLLLSRWVRKSGKKKQAARTVMVKTLSKALRSFEQILLVINLFFFLLINLDVKLKKRN